MKLLLSIPIMFLALAVQATDVTFPFYDLVQSADFFSASTNVVMRIKYNDAPTVYNGRIILKDWRSWTNDPSGSTTITNLVPGRHLVTLTARNSETSFTINVPDTNVTISAATITVTATNSASGTGTAYSQASSDARFQTKTNGISSSEIADGLIATNRLRVKVTNGASPSAGMVLTAIDTNGTAVWSNAPAGSGSGDVTTAQLNLAIGNLGTNSTNFARGTIGAGATNYTDSKIGTLGTAVTNAINSRPVGITNDSTGSGGYVKTISTPTLVYNDAQYSIQDWYDPNGFLLASIGYNPADGQSKYGQFSMFGSATSPYGNVGGFHFWNTNLNNGATNADRRMFVLRVKDPAGGTNDEGGYTLFETRYHQNAPDGEPGAFANSFVTDQYGNVGLGDLGPQSDFSPGVHPHGKVTIYPSHTGSYPPLGWLPADLLGSPVTNSFEWTGSNLYQTDTNGTRLRILTEADGTFSTDSPTFTNLVAVIKADGNGFLWNVGPESTLSDYRTAYTIWSWDTTSQVFTFNPLVHFGGGIEADSFSVSNLNASSMTLTNALGVASGGTGKTNVTAGRMLSGNGTNALDEVIIGSGLSLSGSTGSTRTLTASGGGSGGASYWDTNTSGNITNTGNRKVLINGGIHSAAIFDPDYSLVMGDNAGANAHGSFSVMLGVEAGRYSDQANGGLNGQNVLIGYQAGEFSQAYASTFIGWSAGKACLDAVSQVGVGYGAHQNAVNSSGSVAVGVHAGESIQNSSDSVVAGYHAAGSLGWSNNTGVVAIGGHAAEAWHDSYYGIAIGNYAGNSVTNAAGSIYIGPFTGTNRASTLVIEGSATAVNQNVGGSGALIYGEFDNRRLTFNGTAKVGNTNGSLVAASAAFEVDSTTKGLLLPRMTKTQRDAISSPAAGLMVYQTDNTPGLRVYNGTSWMRFTETAD